jgi:hypothetical protein
LPAPPVLRCRNNSSLINNGTWTAYAGTSYPSGSYSGFTFASAITNAGILNVNAGNGDFTLLNFTPPASSHSPQYTGPVTFTNTGTTNVNTGTFTLSASDTALSTGAINVASDATLTLAASQTFDPSSTIAGTGNITFSSNRVRFTPSEYDFKNSYTTSPVSAINGAYNVTGTTTIIGGSVAFNHDVTLNNLQLSDIGTNTGAFYAYVPSVLASPGTITLTGSGTFTGAYTWTGGPSVAGRNLTIENGQYIGTPSPSVTNGGLAWASSNSPRTTTSPPPPAPRSSTTTPATPTA